MRIPGIQARGHTVEYGPGLGAGVVHETFTCCHCNDPTMVHHSARSLDELGGFCLKCNQATCKKEQCLADCVPFRRKIDEFLARSALHRALRG